MNAKSFARNRIGAALVLAGCVCAGSAPAQDRLADALPDPDVNRRSCEQVNWHTDLLGQYPWAVSACHEVVLVDGQKWARFEAEFQRLNRDGSITSDFRDRLGKSTGRISLMPAPGQRVTLDGSTYQFSELRRGQVLNFYVPEGSYAFSAQPGAPPTERATVVATLEEEPAPAERPVQFAQAEPRPARSTYQLPATAGPLPVIALGGVLSLLGGLGLTMRRRFSKRND